MHVNCGIPQILKLPESLHPGEFGGLRASQLKKGAWRSVVVRSDLASSSCDAALTGLCCAELVVRQELVAEDLSDSLKRCSPLHVQVC